MRKFEDSFSLWFCIIALVLVGIVIGVSTSNTSWIAVVSLLSNIVTILGFALALKAYLHWIKQDTVGVQMQLIREIMMEIAELDCHISDLFSQSVLNEAKLMAVKFPTEEQRDVFNKISPKVQDIKLLIRKYYSIEPSPCETARNLSKHSLSFFTYEGDVFSEIKDLFFKLNKLGYFIKDNNYLIYEDKLLVSSLPVENEFSNSQSVFFYDQVSFTGISVEFKNHLRKIETDLRRMIS